MGQPNDLRMYELDKYMKAHAVRDGDIVEQIVGADRLTSTGYAAAWSLTHYLASREKAKFEDYLRDVAQLGPLEPSKPGGGVAKQQFVKHFGSDFTALETDLVKHLGTLPYADPIANQTHYVVLLDTSTSRTAGVTTSPANARKFQEETLTKLPPALRAASRFQIMPFANKQLAEQYAKQFLGRIN